MTPYQRLAACCLVVGSPTLLFAQSREEFESNEASGKLQAVVEARQEEIDLQTVSDAVVEATNRFRDKHDLSQVESAERLHETAVDFARFMARTGKYGHRADGQRPSARAREHGYEFCIVLENIAYYYAPAGVTGEKLAEQFFDGWKNSPGHRKNLLDADVTEIGVAVAQTEDGETFYAVQMFGRPESATIDFSIINRSGEKVTYETTRPGGKKQFTLPRRGVMKHRRCRPTKIVLQPSGQESRTLAVEDDMRYIVESTKDGLRVETRAMEQSTEE